MFADNINHDHYDQHSHKPTVFSDTRKTELMAQNWREKQANKHEKPQLRQEVSTPSRMTLSKKTEELAANYRLKLLET